MKRLAIRPNPPLLKILCFYVPFLLYVLLATSARAQTATNDLFVASGTGRVIRLDGTTGTTVYDVNHDCVIDLVKGPDGALYVSGCFRVIRVDRATGAPLGVFASGGGLSGAVGVAFGPDGNLYVGSRETNSVIRYDSSTGNFIDTFVPSGSGGLSRTEALLFGPDGNLYVTETLGNRVLRYNGVTGAFLGVFATDPSLSSARSMVFGPDGNLYVAGNSSNNVVRFNGSTGAFIGVFASGIFGANGLAFGPDGNLYVAAESAGKVSRFDGTTGASIGDFASVPGPIGMMFDVTTYEGFNPTFPVYNGGTGFSGAWKQGGFNVSASGYSASENSLSYAGLQTSGGSVAGAASFQINGAIRNLAQSLGADSTTVYLSFLVQPRGTLDDGLFNGFFGLTLNGSLGQDLFIGKPGGPREYVIETRGGLGQVSSGTPTVVGETALLVVKAEFLRGNDRFTLYTNPTPGDPEPATGVVKTDLDLGVVSKVGIYSTGGFAVDEIRIGTTYADVVPALPPGGVVAK